MRMKSVVLNAVGFFSLAAAVCAVSASAQDAPRGKAAELSLHRLEKLVILRRIDPSFLTASTSVTLEAPRTEDPYYIAKIAQVPGADGTRKVLEVQLDFEGRVLRHSVAAGAESVGAPVWPDKDPVTLMEYALHCVVGELIGTSTVCADRMAILEPYLNGFKALTLAPVLGADGVPTGAVVTLEAEGVEKALKVRFQVNGDLDLDNPIEFGAP